MKKTATAILLFDFVAALLLLGFYGLQGRTVAADSRVIFTAENGEEWENLEREDVRKIAITFDGECIIRISQENCLKEAVSMI